MFYERQSRRVRDAVFKKAGLEMIKPSAAERAKWEQIIAPVTEEWIAGNEKAGRPAKAMLADLMANRDKFAKMSWNDQFQMVIDSPVQGVIDY